MSQKNIKNIHYQKLFQDQNKVLNKFVDSYQSQNMQGMDFKNIVFGRQNAPDQYNAQQLQYNYNKFPTQSIRHCSLDFTKINKQVIKQQKERKIVKQQEQVVIKDKNGSNIYKIYLPQLEHSYGLSNKPRTPIQNVVQGSFGNDFDQRQQLLNKYYQLQQQQKQSAQELSPIKQTIATKLFKENNFRNTQNTILNSEMFKMKQFKNIPSLLESSQANFKKSIH